MKKLCTWWIGWRCDGGGAQAWWRCGGDGVVFNFASGRARDVERGWESGNRWEQQRRLPLHSPLAWPVGLALAYGHQVAATACARSATEPGRFESVKQIQSTETTVIPLLYLLMCVEFVKTLVIQSVELCEYYNFALRSIDKFSLILVGPIWPC